MVWQERTLLSKSTEKPRVAAGASARRRGSPVLTRYTYELLQLRM